MKYSLFLILFSICLFGNAQVFEVEGSIYDQETGGALPFVNITINNSRVGSAADIDGHFKFSSKTPITSLTFSYVGYVRFTMPVTSKTPQPLEVHMAEDLNELAEVALVAGENPAHRMVRNASKNRVLNNPEGLSSFSYTSYNKFLITVEQTEELIPFDTIVRYNDADSSWIEIDSSNFQLQNFIDAQHVFLMESVSKRKYQRSPNKDNERVVASRISGLKNPTFTLLATQLQSFSFYNDYIKVLDQDYLNPISKGSTRKYFFVLEDTTITENDSTFIISFRPRPNPNFDALEGLLYITTDGWALKNIIAKPFNMDGLGIEIQQKSKKLNNHWFPVQINYDFQFNSIQVNGIGPVGVGRTYINDVQLEQVYERRDFSRIDVKIADDATKKTEDYWDVYREKPLDAKELETYRVIDSIGDAENFEMKLKWLEALSTGKIRWSIFDFELDKLIDYSIYEGIRLGMGVRTNYDMVDWFTVGGYFGYGFKDRTWKYGYDIDFLISRKSNIGLTLGYYFDIAETGYQDFAAGRKPGFFRDNNYRDLNRQQFDEVSNVYATFRWDIIPSLQSKVFFSRQNRYTMESGYQFVEERSDGSYLVNGFNSTEIGLSLFYAPKDKFMEGPFGRKVIDRTYPTYEVQYTRSIPNVFGSEYVFDKLDVRFEYHIKTRVLGTSQFNLAGGYVWQDVPFSYLYAPKTNRPTNVDWPLQVADGSSFETMYNNEFLSDGFAHFMFRQNLNSRLFHIGEWKPDLELVFRAGYGALRSPDLQQGIEFKTMELGFYETGVELNKILSGLGVGAYFRFGPYQLPEMSENWSVKLSYRTNFF